MEVYNKDIIFVLFIVKKKKDQMYPKEASRAFSKMYWKVKLVLLEKNNNINT